MSSLHCCQLTVFQKGLPNHHILFYVSHSVPTFFGIRALLHISYIHHICKSYWQDSKTLVSSIQIVRAKTLKGEFTKNGLWITCNCYLPCCKVQIRKDIDIIKFYDTAAQTCPLSFRAGCNLPLFLSKCNYPCGKVSHTNCNDSKQQQERRAAERRLADGDCGEKE